MVLGLTWEACSILDGHLGARYRIPDRIDYYPRSEI